MKNLNAYLLRYFIIVTFKVNYK